MTRRSGFIWLALLTVLLAGSMAAETVAISRSTGSTPNTPVGLSGPLHLSHPMAPVASSTALGTSLASDSICPEPAGQCLISYNWGGYAVCVQQPYCSELQVPPTPGNVTDVKGSWTVPTITTANGMTCQDSEKTWYDMSDWVGIDGFVSDTVEQTGTSSDCYYGQVYYYAWYEFYPAPSVTVFNVRPGDNMTAEVSYSVATGNFTTTITDVTDNQSYTSAPTAVANASIDSAEWIAESAYFDGFLALTPVTHVSFSDASATIGGVTRSISGWGTNVYWLLMVDYNFGFNQETGVATPSTETLAYAKAIPSPVVFDRFHVSWLSAGP